MDELKVIQETTQYIKIAIDDEMFGISLKYIDNIVRMQHITRVPKVAENIKGVINLRGEVIPVISLRLKMGLAEIENTKATRIIILKLDGNSVGIVVDEVKEVVTLVNDDIEKQYHDSKNPLSNYLLGVGKDGNGLISLLDISEILSDKN